MNIQEYHFLLAERGELERILAKISPSRVIDRLSFQSRLDSVNAELEKFPSSMREPVSARLTFRGRPVVGSYGIFAEFGAEAVAKFSKMVAAFAASFAGPLGQRGAIPNRDQYQLLITGKALGSFGFELVESLSDPQRDLNISSPVENAIRQVQTLMQATLGSDDEQLADVLSEVDSRAIQEVQGFVTLLEDNDALCTLEFGEKSFCFTSMKEVKRSVKRLSQENRVEQEQSFTGCLQGVLPDQRSFEFRIMSDNTLLRGKVGKDIADAKELNEFLDEILEINVHTTQIGKGNPCHVLLGYKCISRGITRAEKL
ncbi:MAG: hypothetical protein H7832_12105 [Magnetococcus sp. DMHC-6]